MSSKNSVVVIFENHDLPIEVSVEKINKQKAENYLLSCNPNNRKPSKTTLTRYIDDMKSEKWVPVPQGIAFGYDEETGDEMLLDGEHRLRAIIESDKEIEMLVTRGWKLKEAFCATDAGRSKDLSCRTGMDKGESQVINFISNLVHGSGHMSITESERIDNILTNSMKSIAKTRNGDISSLCSAAVRTAFVVSIMAGYKYNAISEMYKSFRLAGPTGSKSLDRARLVIVRGLETIGPSIGNNEVQEIAKARANFCSRNCTFARVLAGVMEPNTLRFDFNTYDRMMRIAKDILLKKLEENK